MQVTQRDLTLYVDRQQEVPNPRWPVDGHILLPALKKVSFLLILLIKIGWSEHSRTINHRFPWAHNQNYSYTLL